MKVRIDKPVEKIPTYPHWGINRNKTAVVHFTAPNSGILYSIDSSVESEYREDWEEHSFEEFKGILTLDI